MTGRPDKKDEREFAADVNEVNLPIYIEPYLSSKHE